MESHVKKTIKKKNERNYQSREETSRERKLWWQSKQDQRCSAGSLFGPMISCPN